MGSYGGRKVFLIPCEVNQRKKKNKDRKEITENNETYIPHTKNT